MSDDIWSQKTEYYDDGVKFGTGPEMITEIKSLSRKLEEARGRIAELQKTGQYGETKSEQAYQVIGSLASLANCFEHPEVIRALDYFGSDRFDPEFLPFAVFDATEAPHTLGDMQEPRLKVVK